MRFQFTRDSILDWVFLLILFSVLVWWYFVQVRHVLRRYRAKHWPLAVATYQKGVLGGVPIGNQNAAA